MSLIGQVGPFLLFGVAAHLITSADMALMMGSAPIFTFLLARMFGLGEVWNARAAAGLALGLVGVALSLGSPFAGGGAAHAGLGRALALVAALGYAGSALLSRPVSRAVGAAMAATGSMAISGALLAAAELVAGGVPSLAVLAAKPAGPLAALVALGLFNTGLAYFVYFRLIETAGATFAALNNYIVPCIGVIAGALALGEPVRPAAWLGLACVLVSVALTGSAAGAGAQDRRSASEPGHSLMELRAAQRRRRDSARTASGDRLLWRRRAGAATAAARFVVGFVELHHRGGGDDAAEGEGEGRAQHRRADERDVGAPQQRANAEDVEGEQQRGAKDADAHAERPVEDHRLRQAMALGPSAARRRSVDALLLRMPAFPAVSRPPSMNPM